MCENSVQKLQKDKDFLEGEEKYRQLFNHMINGYALHEIICDDQGHPIDYRFLDVNPAFERLTGLKAESIVGRTVLEVLPQTELSWIERYGKIALTGETCETIHFEDFSSQINRYFEVTAFCTGHNQFACSFSDITRRKLAEEELRESEKKYKSLIETNDTGYLIIDEKGIVVDANGEYVKLTGHKNINEILGRNVIEWTAKYDLARNKQEVIKCLETGKVRNLQVDYKWENGLITPVEINASIVKFGKDVRIICLCRDMTEKKKNEDFIQKSHKLESLGILAGGIAHDFNNILGAIFGYIEMGIEETTEPLVQTYLSKSISSIDRARALTQQLLTFAKGGEPIKKVGNLFPFVQETAQFTLSGSTVSCRFQIQENLWPCDFDKNQIGQIVDNLIINAQQAMPNGGMIEVSAWNLSLLAKDQNILAAGNYVKLSIKDQGIGIPKEFLPSIFDPYYTTKAKGHGLGLSTCYSIVNRHGGDIDVESEPGKGSTFHIYIPAFNGLISTIKEESDMTHTGCGTFLVMDDEESIRDLLKIMIESFGYTVVLKENGKDAIDFFVTEMKANRKLAGMIFDITIPGGMGGKEAIEEIRQICSVTPAFVSSGYSSDPIMANPEKYGFNASICKPFVKAQLVEMLEKHLKKHK